MGGAVSAVGDAIGDVAGSVGRAVENVIKNPLPVIETLALTAVGVPTPVASGIVNYANGGNIQSAIAAGAGQYLGTEVSEFAGGQGISAPIAKGIGSAVGGTVSALGSGQAPGQALKSGAIKGLGTTAGEYASQAMELDPKSLGSAVVKQGTAGVLSNILGGKSGQKSTQPAVTAMAPVAAGTGAGQVTPSSSALAQVLKTDMGAPIFGGEKEGKPQKWGEGDLTGSSALREMGSGIV
jgi:hypothetical protein